MRGLKIGWGVCGSFCTIDACCREMARLAAENTVVPILSERVQTSSTRFGSAIEVRNRVEGICGRDALTTVEQTETLGPREPLDLLIVAPCTGNSLAKIARGITDGALTMAVKAHLRTDRPLVIALASNDAMAANLSSLALTVTRRAFYFVPMIQDDPHKKPHSLVADFTRLTECADAALDGRQIYPLFGT